MLQPHPEVNQSDQVIGWQPVYSTQQNQQTRSLSTQPNFLLGAAVGVGFLCIAASGGLLWSKAQKTDAEVNAEIQQALLNERERIQTCIATQPEGEPSFPQIRPKVTRH